MQDSVLSQIRRIQRLSVNELQAEWTRLHDGEPCRSRNRTYLVKHLCWRLQELRLGGLSDRARDRLRDLAPDHFLRACPPRDFPPPTETAAGKVSEPRLVRDPRLPSVGTVLTRQYHGREIRVLTLEDGFEWDGRRFGSLSEVARVVTGQHWNGRLFFGLTQRSRRS